MDTKIQQQEVTVYSREFSGTPGLYRRAAIASGLYLGLGIYLGYAFIRYYSAGDASAFSLKGLGCLGLFLVVYIPFAYRTMIKYDGGGASGRGWVQKEATVKLIERKAHRRFV